MSKFAEAIKAQQAWHEKEKPAKPKMLPERREPIKDSLVMQILKLQDKGIPSVRIAKEVNVPVQTVYNVKHRYLLIDVKNGTQWYRPLG
jgi:DNA invertase Pin-like site-specific DNA recombinase